MRRREEGEEPHSGLKKKKGGEASEMFGLHGNMNGWGGDQDFLKDFPINSVKY